MFFCKAATIVFKLIIIIILLLYYYSNNCCIVLYLVIFVIVCIPFIHFKYKINYNNYYNYSLFESRQNKSPLFKHSIKISIIFHFTKSITKEHTYILYLYIQPLVLDPLIVG